MKHQRRFVPVIAAACVAAAAVAGAQHEPFDKARLEALYSTHDAYVSAVRMATEQNLRIGYIVKADAQRTITQAGHSEVGKS